MSAETIREAAALMRKRTENLSSSGPWRARLYDGAWQVVDEDDDVVVVAPDDDMVNTHIASWHPATALAVAEWLDCMADVLVWKGANGAMPPVHVAAAEAVAAAYLGRNP